MSDVRHVSGTTHHSSVIGASGYVALHPSKAGKRLIRTTRLRRRERAVAVVAPYPPGRRTYLVWREEEN